MELLVTWTGSCILCTVVNICSVPHELGVLDDLYIRPRAD